MRCARCDRIYTREHLARDRDGRLVFGWCPECLVKEDCQLSEGPIAPLFLSTRPSLSRRFRRARRLLRRARGTNAFASRRLALLGIAGLLSTWGLILCFVGGVKLARPGGRESGYVFLAASGFVAVVCLAFWLGLIARTRARRMGLKVAQVASAVIAAGTLVLGAIGHATTRDGVVFLVATATLAACLFAQRAKPRPTSGRSKTTASP